MANAILGELSGFNAKASAGLVEEFAQDGHELLFKARIARNIFR